MVYRYDSVEEARWWDRQTLNRGKPGKRNDASVDNTRSGVMVEGVSRVGLVQIPSLAEK